MIFNVLLAPISKPAIAASSIRFPQLRRPEPGGEFMETRTISLAILIGLLAFVLAAQEPAAPQPQQQSLKGVQPKNLAPVSAEVLKVKLPRPVEKAQKRSARHRLGESPGSDGID